MRNSLGHILKLPVCHCQSLDGLQIVRRVDMVERVCSAVMGRLEIVFGVLVDKEAWDAFIHEVILIRVPVGVDRNLATD